MNKQKCLFKERKKYIEHTIKIDKKKGPSRWDGPLSSIFRAND